MPFIEVKTNQTISDKITTIRKADIKSRSKNCQEEG